MWRGKLILFLGISKPVIFLSDYHFQAAIPFYPRDDLWLYWPINDEACEFCVTSLLPK